MLSIPTAFVLMVPKVVLTVQVEFFDKEMHFDGTAYWKLLNHSQALILHNFVKDTHLSCSRWNQPHSYTKVYFFLHNMVCYARRIRMQTKWMKEKNQEAGSP